MNKWIGISLGTVVGISHIGMIGMLANRSSFPKLDLPITEYTSYSVRAGKDGYAINYRANDPLRLGVRKTSKDLLAFWDLVNQRLTLRRTIHDGWGSPLTGSIRIPKD